MGYILYTQRRGFCWQLNNKNILCHENMSIKALTIIIYSGMYNNGYENLLQYIFESYPKKKQIYYPAVGLSRHKLYEVKYQQKYFFLVGTDIYFVVSN